MKQKRGNKIDTKERPEEQEAKLIRWSDSEANPLGFEEAINEMMWGSDDDDERSMKRFWDYVKNRLRSDFLSLESAMRKGRLAILMVKIK
jgi:hypothetical protein